MDTALATTGYWRANDANLFQGFVRSRNGRTAVFGAPNASAPGSVATLPWDMNATGYITGFYIDSNFVWHGFLRTP